MLLDILLKRRSIRKFKDKVVEKDKLDYLLNSALLSPSSRGINPWEFIVVSDKQILKKLSLSKHGAGLLDGAALAIVIIADVVKTDVWVEDTSIVSSNLLIAAEDMDLGACWVQIRNRKFDDNKTANQYVKELLEIPKNYEVESIIGIGYKNEEKDSNKLQNVDLTKIHYEQF